MARWRRVARAGKSLIRFGVNSTTHGGVAGANNVVARIALYKKRPPEVVRQFISVPSSTTFTLSESFVSKFDDYVVKIPGSETVENAWHGTPSSLGASCDFVVQYWYEGDPSSHRNFTRRFTVHAYTNVNGEQTCIEGTVSSWPVAADIQVDMGYDEVDDKDFVGALE